MRLIIFFASFIFVLGACVQSATLHGGDAGADGSVPDAGLDAGSDAGTPFPQNDFCAQVSQAVCDREVTCGYYLASAKAQCVREWGDDCARSMQQVSATRLRYDGRAARDCIDSFKAQQCGVHYPQVCRDAFKPNVPVGALCFYGQCASGYCPFGVDICTQHCARFAEVGEPCEQYNACNPQTGYCEALTDGGYGCTAYTAAGQACTSSSYCGIASSYCKGARIDYWGNVLQQGQCAARIALGQNCVNEEFDDGCLGDAVCLEGKCQIVAPGTRAHGQTCENDSHCGDDDFCAMPYRTAADGGIRVTDGICQSRPATNDFCDVADYYTTCRTSDFCQWWSSGVCTPYRLESDVCDDDHLCLNPLVCYDLEGSGTRHCFGLRLLNQTCSRSYSTLCADTYCALDAGAAIGKCLPRLGNTVVCESYEQCASLSCLDPFDGGLSRCGNSCF